VAQFRPNQPVVQADPSVKVEVSAANPLPVGSNRFQLVVVDDQGNLSQPVVLEVIVAAAAVPTAVLEMVDDNGQRIEPRVQSGRTFTLSGAKSSDVPPGRVVEYRFTLLPRP
jgi:hypothetical protein